MSKRILLSATYLSGLAVAADVAGEWQAGAFALAFAFLLTVAYDRLCWRPTSAE